jgi:hypothetical protein
MPPQPELDAAVAGAKTKGLLDGWKWDRKSGALITPLIACTNALWGHRTQGAPEVYSVRESLERLRGEQPQADATPNFIPWDQMPVRRGLFQP